MRSSHVLLRSLLGAGFAGAMLTVLPATAAVYSPQQALPAKTVQQFLANANAMLAQSPNGGPEMIAQVRDLAATDPATLSALIGLLARANPDQAVAIGSGLGAAATMAASTDQRYAARIQAVVVVANEPSALTAFRAEAGGGIGLAAATRGGGCGCGGPTGRNTPLPFTTFPDISPRQSLPRETVQQFLANANAMLAQYPNGGPRMIAEVRELAAADPATLDALLGLLARANRCQALAIGTGLGEVAKRSGSTGQDYARQIRAAVVAANDDCALTAFAAEAGGGGEPSGDSGGFFAGAPLPFTTSATNTPDNFLTTGLSSSTPSVAVPTVRPVSP